jgi:8-oxo-dGTP pyrophosphatase MutT (NUDIX family)
MAIGGNFLTARGPLRASSAVAAIIVVEGSGYLMQLRDDIPQIWYPGHWGLFGGAVDPGEDEITALRRELHEEIELELAAATLFARFDFDLAPMGLERYSRAYYEVRIDAATRERLVLQEGAEMGVFGGDEALSMRPLSPYDGFALFLHHHRTRISV